MMRNIYRLIGMPGTVVLTVMSLAACIPTTPDTSRKTAQEMISAEISLAQPAGPDLTRTSTQESPAPLRSSATETGSASLTASTIPPEELMRVAPFDEPKRIHEFSQQGATNLVAYYMYAAYYGFVARDTQLMRQTYTRQCEKCLAMSDWIDRFVSDNEKVETGVPKTVVIDAYSERKEGNFYFWVVASNQEPPIIGKNNKGEQTGFDPGSISKALYRVEYVEGRNQITGIFQIPRKYK